MKNTMVTTRRYIAFLNEEPEEDGGGYWAEVEELPGCFASGDTLGGGPRVAAFWPLT